MTHDPAGNTLASTSYRVDMAAIVRYAGASGDFTPIHYDADELAAADYDRFFAMGMLVAGRLGALVAQTFGDDAVRTFEVRFRTRSWVGTNVHLTLSAGSSPGEVTLLATADGDVLVTGTAHVSG